MVMNNKKISYLMILAVTIILILTVSCQTYVKRFAETENKKPPEKILFIGDSLTYWNMGIYYHVLSLAESETPPRKIVIDSLTQGSTPLGGLWPRAQTLIKEGKYDLVVLQDDLGETSRTGFLEYAKKYNELITQNGGRSILYMHYWYSYLKITPSELKEAYRNVAKELRIPISPVYTAYEYAANERPSLELIAADFIHPTWTGTYLISCVLYSTIFGRSPEGLPYNPTIAQLTSEEVLFLQRIAWKAVKEFRI